jgi:transcriptional regulator with XRE-family HTH domain
MVVQIEAARTNPSVGTLCRIADAFGVTVAQLLEPAAERTVRVIRAADAPLLWRGGYGGFGRLLGGVSDPDFVELWEWRLAPHDRHESSDHAPGTRELVHVLTGELTIAVDGTEHLIRPAETIDFRADKAHEYRNDGDVAVRLLMVVVMPAGDFDRRPHP